MGLAAVSIEDRNDRGFLNPSLDHTLVVQSDVVRFAGLPRFARDWVNFGEGIAAVKNYNNMAGVVSLYRGLHCVRKKYGRG
jgi:hypothetical protein